MRCAVYLPRIAPNPLLCRLNSSLAPPLLNSSACWPPPELPPGPSGSASPLAATPPTHLTLGLPRLCRSKLAHPSRIHLEQILRCRRRLLGLLRHGGRHRWKRTNASRDFIKGRRGFFWEDGANLWHHQISPRAQQILAAVAELQRFVQRWCSSSLGFGGRAEAVDERDDGVVLFLQ